jgi:hypothetical protein
MSVLEVVSEDVCECLCVCVCVCVNLSVCMCVCVCAVIESVPALFLHC